MIQNNLNFTIDDIKEFLRGNVFELCKRLVLVRFNFCCSIPLMHAELEWKVFGGKKSNAIFIEFFAHNNCKYFIPNSNVFSFHGASPSRLIEELHKVQEAGLGRE